MVRNIVKQLRSLKHAEINPSPEWIASERVLLLSQIKNTLPSNEESNPSSNFIFIFQNIFSFKNLRPVMVVLAVVFGLPSIWIASGKAASGSLPGDTLYSTKRAVEKTQVAFASLVGDKDKEVQLHLQFAQRRVEEVQKVSQDPTRKMELNETVTNLKKELSTVNEKLVNFKNEPNSVSNQLVKDVQKQTGEIKNTLQEVKQSLQISSSTEDKNLSKEVVLVKDLVKQVDMNTIDVAIASHLTGNNVVSRQEVISIIDNSLATAAADLGNSKQSVEGVRTIVNSVQAEFATSTKNSYTILSTSTQDLNDKISHAILETTQAADETKVVSDKIDKKVAETKELLINGNLSEAAIRLKEVNEATKEVEIIYENTINKVQTVLPLVQVIKVKDVNTTSTNQIQTTTIATSSLVIPSTSSVVAPSNTLLYPGSLFTTTSIGGTTSSKIKK